MVMDLSQFKQQVQRNCDISDASYAGLYSLCGLMLRLRDYYKWEQHLHPWQEPEPAELMAWVEAREQYWETLLDQELTSLDIGTERFEPFAVTEINQRLRPLGLVYSAGFVGGMKPSFFLAEMAESQIIANLQIDIVDREQARDLFTAPAMRQRRQIFARRSAMVFLLWDQILEMRPSVKTALSYALGFYGLEAEAIRRNPLELGPGLLKVVEQEIGTWIYHEIGEAYEETFPGQAWQEIVSNYANSPIEAFARAVKDLLADTHEEGLLGHIIRSRRKSSLGFYVSLIRPFTRVLFPQLREAFERFVADGDWTLIETARQGAYTMAHRFAKHLLKLHEGARGNGTQWAKDRIIEDLIEPLGVLGGTK